MRIGQTAHMRIGVNGAAGRMGRTVCAAVVADPDLVFAAAVDLFGVGQTIEGIEVGDQLEAFAGCDVVDVTHSVRTARALPAP